MRTDKDDVTIVNEELKKIESPFIRKEEILKIVPVANSTLYQMINDGKFPKQKTIGRNISVWSRKEVMEWVAAALS
jgi:predicted DNA-binding transcriptional regulator AlpA